MLKLEGHSNGVNAALWGAQGALLGYLGAFCVNKVAAWSVPQNKAAYFLAGTSAITKYIAERNEAVLHDRIPQPLKRAITIGFSAFVTTKVMDYAGMVLALPKYDKYFNYAKYGGYGTVGVVALAHIISYGKSALKGSGQTPPPPSSSSSSSSSSSDSASKL